MTEDPIVDAQFEDAEEDSLKIEIKFVLTFLKNYYLT
jgi:hypothetical protein